VEINRQSQLSFNSLCICSVFRELKLIENALLSNASYFVKLSNDRKPGEAYDGSIGQLIPLRWLQGTLPERFQVAHSGQFRRLDAISGHKILNPPDYSVRKFVLVFRVFRSVHPLKGGVKRTEFSANSCPPISLSVHWTFRARPDSAEKVDAETGRKNHNSDNLFIA
jgi:hypothetical protein